MSIRTPPLVLVVDDFADARELYGDFLRLSGFRVAEAADGFDACEKAVALLPQLILMDLSMPGMDGWETTRRLKADARTAGIPIIALTGYSMAAHAERARQAGCVDVIVKPCLPPDLVQKVEAVLGA